MIFFKKYFSILTFNLVLTFSACAETLSPIDVLSRNQITEVTLNNGLRICLKKSNLEPNEFVFQLFALGGIAHMPISDQPSTWLAANIAWASGLNQLTGDELECAIDDHSLEMNLKIDLFDRKIEAAGPTTELEYCFHIIKLFFTQPQFNESGLNEALTQTRKRLLNIEQANKLADEELALKINFKNWYTVAPFHTLDLDRVDLRKAQEIFKKLFLNPAEFTLVIVGDFDPQQTINLLEKTLGSLQKRSVMPLNPIHCPSFPNGITKKELRGATRYRESLTRLTFPLSHQIQDPFLLDLLCLILKQELISESNHQELDKMGFTICYSFPLFPYLQPCWLAIKFTSSEQDAPRLQQEIIRKMEKIKQRGLNPQIVRVALQELANRREQNSDNAYTLASLTYFCKAGWKIEHIYFSPSQNLPEKEIMKKLTDCYPSFDRYSIISLYP